MPSRLIETEADLYFSENWPGRFFLLHTWNEIEINNGIKVSDDLAMIYFTITEGEGNGEKRIFGCKLIRPVSLQDRLYKEGTDFLLTLKIRQNWSGAIDELTASFGESHFQGKQLTAHWKNN